MTVPPPRASRLLFQLPQQSRTFKAIEPGNNWTWNEVLLNKAAYLIETLVWQNSKDAQKKAPRNKPKPFIPDFMQKQSKQPKNNKGMVVAETSEIKDLLSRPRTK